MPQLPALVLTAGLGTRLDPLTRLLAKPAMPLAGRTLIERVLDWLRSQHIGKVVLNLHHLPETVTSVVGDGAHLGLQVRYTWESPILGSAGGPRRALPLLDSDSFLIVNGDTLCGIDLEALIHSHAASGADVTMAVVPNPAPDRYNGIVLDGSRRITAFVPKGQATGSWHFVGVQVVKSSVFASLTDGVAAETVSGLYRERVNAGDRSLRGFAVEEPFFDVGTASDYLHAALALSGSDNAVESSADVAPTAHLSKTVVWSGGAVGGGAELDRCVVAGVRIPDGFRAADALLLPSSVVRSGDSAMIVDGVAQFALVH